MANDASTAAAATAAAAAAVGYPPTSQHHCKDCGLYFESAKSLEVHFQYHKENLLSKWATQAHHHHHHQQQQQQQQHHHHHHHQQQQQHHIQHVHNNDVETNNNNTTTAAAVTGVGAGPTPATTPAGGGAQVAKVKRDTGQIADDGIMMTKPSPEFQQRSTPETSGPFGHPATPQSYHSAPSPYQTPEQTGFSPGQYPPYGPASTYVAPPADQQQQQHVASWEQQQQNHYTGEYVSSHRPARFHPYAGTGLPERSSHVSSTSPVYGQPPSQPTPSPSPKQCDKCGFVCDSAAQLNEHCTSTHPPTPHFRQTNKQQQQQQQPHYADVEVKDEQEESADILDLDSQKVVHPGGEENGLFDQQSQHHHQQPHHHHHPHQQHMNGPNPHSVSAMLSWPDGRYGHAHMNGDSQQDIHGKLYGDQKLFGHDHNKLYEQKMYHHHHQQQHEAKMFGHHQEQQKLYQPHQMGMGGDYQAGPSSTSSAAVARQDMHHQMGPSSSSSSGRSDVLQSGTTPSYRGFESGSGSQISSSQAANSSVGGVPPISGRGANWKSNEARRPKTYNCTACNKWFTSSGHLKRHYNTTLHKNAVRSSGQPDPATMPISTHHHPARDPTQHSTRGQQQNSGGTGSGSDPNAHSPLASDDVRSPDDSGQGAAQFSAPAFERSIKGSSYMHQHPNAAATNNHQPLGNNPLANHPLPHQIGGTHPLAMGNQPPGLGNPLVDSGHMSQQQQQQQPDQTGSPNGLGGGPPVHLNHHHHHPHSRGLLSVSLNNAMSPLAAAHNLPPFGHLPPPPPANHHPFNAVGSEQDAPPPPPPPSIYLPQNFQQNHPNGMSPHVMDTASSITSTIGDEIIAEQYGIEITGPLPSFAQFQSQRFGGAGLVVPNFSPMHNVGGTTPGDATTPHIQSYVIIDSSFNYLPTQNMVATTTSPDCGGDDTADGNHGKENYIVLEVPPKEVQRAPSGGKGIMMMVKSEPYMDENSQLIEFELPIKTMIKHEEEDEYQVVVASQESQDGSNKENYESQVRSPASPITVQIEYENNGSPSISSTTSTGTSTGGPPQPLSASNKQSSGKASGANGGATEIHKCFECDKLFNRACYLTQHNKSFHSGAKPYKCGRCGKRFPDDVSYEGHYVKHAGEKPFKCDQCPKQFNHKTDLRRHMCLHSGEKPFSCYYCGKGFIRKDHMLKHVETHSRKNKCA